MSATQNWINQRSLTGLETPLGDDEQHRQPGSRAHQVTLRVSSKGPDEQDDHE